MSTLVLILFAAIVIFVMFIVLFEWEIWTRGDDPGCCSECSEKARERRARYALEENLWSARKRNRTTVGE